jgi:hypothetical protein
MSTLSIPNPGHPANGDDLDADVVRAQITQLLQYLQSLDLSNSQAGSFPESAWPTALNMRQRFGESFSNFVYSGLNPSGFSTLTFTFPSGVVYINGYRVPVTGQSFTVGINQDTYYDVDVNGTITASPVTNNTASPALAANSIRLLIVVSNGTTITNLNQGSASSANLTPRVSNRYLQICDTLGNLIYPTDPSPKLVGQGMNIAANYTAGTGANNDIPGMFTPVIVPAGRDVKLTATACMYGSSGAIIVTNIYEGATQLGQIKAYQSATNAPSTSTGFVVVSPTPGLHTYKAVSAATSGNANIENNTAQPSLLTAELV